MAVRKKPGAKRKTKTPARKPAAKKAPARKAAAKKSAAKKPAAKKPAAKKTAAKKTAARKAAAKKASAKKAPAKTRASKSAASRTAARKPAAGRRSAPKKPARKTNPVKRAGKAPATKRPAAKSRTASRKSAAKRPQAAAPPPAPAAPPRPPARKAARRMPPVRVAEPRSTGVRKVAVRTAVQRETSRAPRPDAARKPGKPALADLVKVEAPAAPRQEMLLTPEALEFLALLHRQFDGRRLSLLARRHERQARFDAGERPDFLRETRHVRSSGWRVTGLPARPTGSGELVVAPGPEALAAAIGAGPDRVIVDFEDAAPPSWHRVVAGHVALLDHWASLAADEAPGAEIVLRPRGWHLPEGHVVVDGVAVSAALVDTGLALVHSARRQRDLGRVPHLCLPKLESYLEARLWSDVLTFAERHLGLARGACKVTVQIETLPAAFEMDEIVFELREHVAGLAFVPAGLIASMIRRLGRRADLLMPDRDQIGSRTGFLAAVEDRLVRLCHRRGIASTGADALGDGAPPANGMLEEDEAARDALLAPPTGRRTKAGLTASVALVLQHLSLSLADQASTNPADAAEAEIARALAWQWLHQAATLDDGETVTSGLLDRVVEEAARKSAKGPEAQAAIRLFLDVIAAPDCDERLSLLAYRQILERGF